MIVVSTRSGLAAARDRLAGPMVLVPTLGALHDGHRALLRRARQLAGPGGAVAVSIFVLVRRVRQRGDVLEAELPVQGGHVHHHPAAGLQAGPSGAGEVEDQVDLVAAGSVPIVVPDALELAEVRPAGQIEHDVEPAELTQREVDEPGAVRRIVKQARRRRPHARTSAPSRDRCCRRFR
jgi:hypothetical protein